MATLTLEELAEALAPGQPIAGLDLGTKTIGLSVSDLGRRLATPRPVLKRVKFTQDAETLLAFAGKEKVAAAFKIITADPKVEGILVNIFGGIMKCDVIAEGVVAAVQEVGLKVPLVVRLEGTNVELGKKILNESGLAITAADDLDDAAKKIVAAING